MSNNSVTIYSTTKQSWVERTAIKAKREAVKEIKEVYSLLEKMLKIRLYGRLEIRRQHYAKINDSLAKLYRNKKKKLQVRDDDGLWLLADQSFNIEELETVHKKTEVKDMDGIIVKFMNSLKKHPEFDAQWVMNSFGLILQDRMKYAKNIKAHVTAIKKMASILSRLEKHLKK